MVYEATDLDGSRLAAPFTGGLAIWRRWKPSDCRTAGLLVLLIVLQLVGAFLMPPRTTRLHLRGRDITDAAISLLSAAPELEDLDLRDSAVTDAGLTTLTRLPALRRVDLRDSAVTDGGVVRLAAALPNCEIVR